MRYALKSCGVFKFVEHFLLFGFAFYHGEKEFDIMSCLINTLPLDQIDHKGGRCLRYRASGAYESRIGYDAVFDLKLERDVVAAAGVDALERIGRSGNGVTVMCRAAVLRDYLSVERFKIQGPSNS